MLPPGGDEKECPVTVQLTETQQAQKLRLKPPRGGGVRMDHQLSHRVCSSTRDVIHHLGLL